MPVRALRLLLTGLAALAACGGADDGGADAADDHDEDGTTTTAPVEPLTILVSNDDGYAADGIATLVDALLELPDVEVTVVAPDGNRSGSGGQTTPEGVAVADVTMANGFAATSVSGFPADAVVYALDTLGLTPDLVVTGSNEGQNLGPAVDLSGTVGAARVAAQRGIPAVATSAGFGTAVDYEATVDVVVDWLVEHRADLEGATADQVVNINVPTCAVGEVRDVVEVASSTIALDETALRADIDCTVTGEVPADDVSAFNLGFATITVVPALPA